MGEHSERAAPRLLTRADLEALPDAPPGERFEDALRDPEFRATLVAAEERLMASIRAAAARGHPFYALLILGARRLGPSVVVVLATLGVVAGCATLADVRAANRENLLSVAPGMTRAQVLETMGTRTVRPIAAGGEVVTNPYRTETIRTVDGRSAEILFYYTDLKKRDGAITDDELTPIVLEDGRVAGWGWSFLERNVDRYQVELRVR